MKKSTSIILRVCGICMLIGIIMIVIGAAGGGDLNGRYRFIPINNEIGEDVMMDLKDEKIVSLNIDTNYGNVIIKEGDAFNVEHNLKEQYINCYVENDVLCIKTTKRNGLSGYVFGNNSGNNNQKIVITIPNDYQFEDVSLELGAGLAEISDLHADTAEFSIGAGKIDIKKMTSTQKSSFEIGAGAIHASQVELANVSIECGIGEGRFRGNITGDSKVECGVGKVELELTGDSDDYNYKLNCAIGSINVDGDSYSMVGDKKIAYSDTASNFMKLDCGVGTIQVTTNN